MNKQVYTSELGKLYAEKQGLRNGRSDYDLNIIAESVYQSFVFFIKCGETLPIIASPVELVGLTFSDEDREYILAYLKEKGCVVKCSSMCSFTLINLL